jgi:hypothetical protein
MINKEIVKQFVVRSCPKLAFNMASSKGVLRIFEKMLELGIEEDEIIEGAESEEAFEDRLDSIFEMLKLYPDLRSVLKKKLEAKEKEDEIASFINSMKNYQEVSNLSRLYILEEYQTGVFRADTYDLSLDGLEITDNDQIIANTKKLLANPVVKVILEGQVVVGSLVARWDVLVKSPDGWELYEVKGTNSVFSGGAKKGKRNSLKKEYLYDIAFQYEVYKRAGIKISNVGFIYLDHHFKLSLSEISYPIDKQYVKDLFYTADMIYIKEYDKKEDKKIPRLITIKEYLDEEYFLESSHSVNHSLSLIIPFLEKVIAGEEPDIKLDYGCKTKQGCLLLNECHKDINANHLFTLTNNGNIGGNWRTVKKYLDDGIDKISDIPEEDLDEKYPTINEKTTKKLVTRMQINIAKGRSNGKNIVEFKYLAKLLELEYSKKPLLFFDFETFNYPIPLVEEASPWEQICSQYSMHVLKDNYDLGLHNFEKGVGGNITHYEFIGSPYHDQHRNPERDLIVKLKQDFAAEGINYKDNQFKLVVYNKSFELTQFNRMSLKYPEHQEFLDACAKNIIDLNDIFTKGLWYRDDFNGRTSLKVTQPKLMNDPSIKKWYKNLPYDLNKTLDYKSELVQNGGVALELYQTMLRMRADGKLVESMNNKIKDALLKYCKIDSWGTVILYDIMAKTVKMYQENNLSLEIDNMNLLNLNQQIIFAKDIDD